MAVLVFCGLMNYFIIGGDEETELFIRLTGCNNAFKLAWEVPIHHNTNYFFQGEIHYDLPHCASDQLALTPSIIWMYFKI